MPKGFKFVDGVMVADTPAATANIPMATVVGAAPSAPPMPQLAIVTSVEEMQNANSAASAAGVQFKVTANTAAALNSFDDPNLAAKYRTQAAVDGDAILDKIAAVFSQYEVPIGLLSKLLALNEYNLDIVIDDSSSMGSHTTAKAKQVSTFLRNFFQTQGRNPESNLTRWEEAQDMLHILMDLLAYIPTGQIKIHFLNSPDFLILDRNGLTPDAFADQAHAKIHSTLHGRALIPYTPLGTKLGEMFRTQSGKTKHYVFTDGEPSDTTVASLEQMIINRPASALNPLTLVGCTDQEEDVQWLEDMERFAPWVAAVDYYDIEREEIMKLQGPVFPYSKGLWLMCMLVGDINPDDLDDLDSKDHILTKHTLDTMLGRHITPQEYMMYWNAHPLARSPAMQSLFSRFATEEKCAREITGRRSSVSAAVSGTIGGISAGISRMRPW